MKTCTGCKQTKPLDGFFRDTRKPGHLMSRCKVCKAQTWRNWKKKNPDFDSKRYWQNRDSERERHLVRKYGVTFKIYMEMLAIQDGKCAICSRPQSESRMLDVDHDHATNEVRGLLCSTCNRLIGYAADSVPRLQAAVDYLSSRKSRNGSGGKS